MIRRCVPLHYKEFGMSNDNKNTLFKTLHKVLKIITFPIYIVFYALKKLIQKSRISLRLSFSLVHLKIVIRILGLISVLMLFAYGTHKLYFIYDNYKQITEHINTDIKIEHEVLKNILGDKHHAAVYDENKKFLFSTSFISTNGAGRQGYSPTIYEYKKFFSFDVIDNKYFFILDKEATVDNKIFFLNIYSDITAEIVDIFKLLKIILLVDAIGIIYAIVLSFASGRNIFLPISEMTEAAKTISEKNMNVRLNVSSSKSELKDLARTFNEMMDRIEDGYNRQKQFVSDASHELRTPIAVLQGYVDMLNRWGKNDKEVLQESIDAIKNEAENMKDLVEKLLFLARNDRGTLILQKEDFNLTSLLEETIRETTIIDKKHKLNFNIQRNVNIYADRNSIKQAIRIFLDNAMKYTPKDGIIEINLSAEKKDVIIEILDTGIGMTEEEMQHMFDRFYRSDKSRKREKGGHGLGLSIAKIIILSHGGKINVKSKPSVGTNIRLILPKR